MQVTLTMALDRQKSIQAWILLPTIKDDAREVVKKCKDYQFIQKQTTKHANPLRPIDISWPIAIWGIDIVGILSKAPGGFRYLFVGVDTFTK
jgi:hypothetical protein